jgi:hypothetical protein
MEWTDSAVESLLALRTPGGGWGYQAGGVVATEPTAVAVLALAGSIAAGELTEDIDRLLEHQLASGMFTAETNHFEPSWSTPLAALALNRVGQNTPANSAAGALLAMPIFTFDPLLAGGIYGYDTSIPGWPWTYGDFSFVEPTALAMIALKRLGNGNHQRVREGAATLRSRALAAGGWNYGEPMVLGGTLFPTAAPTALALLALADEQDEITAAALNWLQGQRGQISSLFSLCWAAIALNVLGVSDEGWKSDVMTLWDTSLPQRRGPLETALALLAVRQSDGHPLAVTG